MIFQNISELSIGELIEVDGTKVKIAISKNLDDLIKIYKGRVYAIGQIGSIIKILYGRKIIFINVTMLRMKNNEDENDKMHEVSNDIRVIEGNILCEGEYNNFKNDLDVTFGIETYPLPLQKAYIMTIDEMDCLYASIEKESLNNNEFITIGKHLSSNTDCNINIDKLFGHHCAILGSTGSGKSAATAAILHTVLNNENLHPNIILLDSHGEYGTVFQDKAKIYMAYNTDNTICEQLHLPYWVMSSNELREFIIGKTEFEATSQNNIVYQAIGYAKMITKGIIKRFSDETTGNEDFILCDGKNENDLNSFDRDLPIPFDIEDLIFHIDRIQGYKSGEKKPKSASDRKDIDSILRKIKVLRTNVQMKFIFDNKYKSIKEVISQLFSNDKVKIIDISGIPNEVAGTLTAIISRLAFQYKIQQNRNQREKTPVLLVLEEAHRYVPNSGEAQYKEAQFSIRRIAKEGRKYGLGLMLVSQRPSDIEPTVLSQCNTWIILKITNSNDKTYIANYLPDYSTTLINSLSSLGRREAIIVGNAVSMPCRIKIKMLSTEEIPDSNDISFINGWSTETTDDIIEDVVSKWII